LILGFLRQSGEVLRYYNGDIFYFPRNCKKYEHIRGLDNGNLLWYINSLEFGSGFGLIEVTMVTLPPSYLPELPVLVGDFLTISVLPT